LIEDARFAAGVTGSRLRRLPEWLELIRGFVAAYVCPADEIGATGVARTLRALSDLDDVAASLGDRAVSYRVAAELCRARLRRIGGERGQHLARGVAVASFVPMRAIPFRAIFLVGLCHGAFPSAPRRDELDLRAARRLPGDVSPREQDLYMFLETLLGARERLVLSYVARDELTGDRLEPSSVILELGDILRGGYLPADEARRLFDPPTIPLRRFDDDERLDAHPPALRESRARALGRSLAAALPPDAPPPELSSLGELLPPATYHQITTSLGLHRPAGAGGRAPRADAGAGVAQVSLQTLRQFLEDPLQGAAGFRLRMREIAADEECIDRDDEPFESDRTARTLRLRAAMLSVLARGPSGGPDWSIGAPTWAEVRAAHAALARRDELLGRIPTGFFREAEGPAEEEILATWWEHARTVGGGWPAVGRILRFGRAAELEPADDLRDPIVLSVSVAGAPARRLEIVGRTELVVAPKGDAPGGSLVFSCRSARRDDPRADRELLRAFLDHVALAAAGLSQGAHEALLAVASGTTRQSGPRSALDRRLLAPVEPARAREYLETLAAELLEGAPDPATGQPTGVHPYLLPHEAVFASRAAKNRKDLIELIEDLRDEFAERGQRFSSAYGPVPQAVERHLPPSPEDAARMVDRRFGLLFELLRQPVPEAVS
jgi:exodeoxyribonuclease V gamma subunit